VLGQPDLTPKEILDFIYDKCSSVNYALDFKSFSFLADFLLKKGEIVGGMQIIELGTKFCNTPIEAFTHVLNAHAAALSAFTEEIPSIFLTYEKTSEEKYENDWNQWREHQKQAGLPTDMLPDMHDKAALRRCEIISEIRPVVDPHYEEFPEAAYSLNLLKRHIWNTPASKTEVMADLFARFLPEKIDGTEDWDSKKGEMKLRKKIVEKMKTMQQPWSYDPEHIELPLGIPPEDRKKAEHELDNLWLEAQYKRFRNDIFKLKKIDGKMTLFRDHLGAIRQARELRKLNTDLPESKNNNNNNIL